VRRVAANGQQVLAIFVENAGEFVVPFDAVDSVHAQKIILNREKLAPELR